MSCTLSNGKRKIKSRMEYREKKKKEKILPRQLCPLYPTERARYSRWEKKTALKTTQLHSIVLQGLYESWAAFLHQRQTSIHHVRPPSQILRLHFFLSLTHTAVQLLSAEMQEHASCRSPSIYIAKATTYITTTTNLQTRKETHRPRLESSVTPPTRTVFFMVDCT